MDNASYVVVDVTRRGYASLAIVVTSSWCPS